MTADTITAAAKAFGLGAVVGEPRPLTEAWSNTVVRLRTDTGNYVVKLLSPETLAGVEHGTEVEAAVLATGRVPMAEPIADRNGGWLTRLPDGRLNPAPTCQFP